MKIIQFHCKQCEKIFWLRIPEKELDGYQVNACKFCGAKNIEQLFPRNAEHEHTAA